MRKGAVIKLEDACNVEYGTRVVQKRDGGRGYPVYGGGGATFEMDMFNREDRLVIARFGMSKECTRFVAGKFYLNDSGLTVSPKNGSMDQRFLDYQMLSLNDVIYSHGKGTAQKNLEVPVFRTLPIFVTTLDEQKRIVEKLDEAFVGLAKAKENSEKNLQNARALFESHLQSVFTQRGKGWEDKRLGEICSFLNRGISPRYLKSGGICVLNQKCIRDHRVSFELSRRHDINEKKVAAERLIQLGDVLVNSTGTGTLGRVAQLRETPSEPTTVDSHVTIVRPIPGMFYTEFFGYMLVFIENGIKEAGEGCGGQTELARSVLAEKFSVSYPVSLSDQSQHVVKLDSLSEETQRLARLYERKLEALESLKKSILHEAFSGNL